MQPGTLRNLLLPTSDTEANLKGILANDYDPTFTYRVATTRSLPRRLNDGWQSCGLSEGDLYLIRKPKGD